MRVMSSTKQSDMRELCVTGASALRVDMFLMSAWKVMLVALMLFGIMLLIALHRE